MAFEVMKFYAVKRGHYPGIYRTWYACKTAVDGFSNPIFKRFSTQQEADAFMGEPVPYRARKAKKNRTASKRDTPRVTNPSGEQVFYCGEEPPWN